MHSHQYCRHLTHLARALKQGRATRLELSGFTNSSGNQVVGIVKRTITRNAKYVKTKKELRPERLVLLDISFITSVTLEPPGKHFGPDGPGRRRQEAAGRASPLQETPGTPSLEQLSVETACRHDAPHAPFSLLKQRIT